MSNQICMDWRVLMPLIIFLWVIQPIVGKLVGFLWGLVWGKEKE